MKQRRGIWGGRGTTLFGRGRRAGRTRRPRPTRERRCAFEMLEPRQLLSAGPLPLETCEWLGLEPLDLGSTPAAGQVIYLDFDGATGLTYHGPVTIAGIDVPAFSSQQLQQAGSATVAAGSATLAPGSATIATSGSPTIAPGSATIATSGSPTIAPGSPTIATSGSPTIAPGSNETVSAGGGSQAALDEALINTITSQVAHLLSWSSVDVTNQPPAAAEYSTIYIGGDGRQFAAYGDFLGLAEAVDTGNRNPGDQAFVFSDKLLAPGITTQEYALAVSRVAAHEAGHLLGMAHPEQFAGEQSAAPTPGPLDAVAHKMEPGMEVHQWIAWQAYKLYASQFDFGAAFGGFGELGSYLVIPGLNPDSEWPQLAAATHNQDGDNNILEGTADEDTTDNPFGQRFPYFRHFAHGGDGAEMYQGLDDWWIPGSDPGQGGSYYSNLEQTQFYWYGWESGGHQPGLIESYAAGAKDVAYWYLGHVGHLLADMTVPAHVHGDAHGGALFGGNDAYEDWVGADSHFQLFPWTTTAPGWQIGLPTGLEDWFYLTADYVEDYDSDDYDGWDAPGEGGPEYAAGFRAPGRHRPQDVENNGDLTDTECQLVASDLLPWAIEQTASLYRLFYSVVDTTDPVVGLPGFSLNVDQPTLVTAPNVAVSATANDPESGVGHNLYQFYTAAWTGADWGPWQPHGQGPAADVLGPFGDGLYALTASAVNGAGQTAYSPVGYFVVDLNDPPVAEAGGPYVTDEGTSVLLDASASHDPDGMIVSYTWDLDDDGEFDDAVGPTTLFAARHGTYDVHVQVIDDQGAPDTDSATVTVNHVPAEVVGRQVFYNNSAFDDPAGGRSDADAIAPDKSALLPGGLATFANYTSYDKGLNGIFIDVDRLDGLPGPGDFEFLVGGVGRFDAGPQSWTDAPPDPQISVQWATTPDQPDRIKLIWPDGTIRNQWLMVRLKATATTGLAEDDVFLFGNAAGESGNSPQSTYVDGSDFAGARDHFDSAALLDNHFDYNRDGRVDPADMELVRTNPTNFATCLKLLDLSAWVPISSGPLGDPTSSPATMPAVLAQSEQPQPVAEPADATIRSFAVPEQQGAAPVEAAVDAVFSDRELWLWFDVLQEAYIRRPEERRGSGGFPLTIKPLQLPLLGRL